MPNANTIVVMVTMWPLVEISKISKVIHYVLVTEEFYQTKSYFRKNWWLEMET